MNLEEVKTYKMGKKHRGDPGDGRRWPRPNTRQHLAVIPLAVARPRPRDGCRDYHGRP